MFFAFQSSAEHKYVQNVFYWRIIWKMTSVAKQIQQEMNLKLALTVSPSYLRLLLHKYIEHICITSIKMAIINEYS